MPEQRDATDAPDATDRTPEVLSPDGITSAVPGSPDVTEGQIEPAVPEGEEIASPAKIIRIGAMIKQLLEEVRNTDLDEASRDHLREIYENSVRELKDALSPELGEELDQLSFDFSGEDLPSSTELRLAKAQLVGWLEGVFHGIQATLMAQQMAMRQQLEGMRTQLPEQSRGPGGGPGYL
jgi:hypothetical protein